MAAALRPLPHPVQETIDETWQLIATEAGRVGQQGVRATMTLLNGEAKAHRTLVMGNVQQQREFAADMAALIGCEPAVILAALPRVALAIDAVLRAMPAAHAEKDEAKRMGTPSASRTWSPGSNRLTAPRS